MLFNQLQGFLQVVGGVTWHDLKHNRLTEDVAWSDIILWRVNQTLCSVASEVWFMGLPSWWRVSRWYCSVSNCNEIWTPPDVLSVYSPFWGAYIRKGGKFAFQNWLGRITVGSEFIVFALFYLVFKGNFPNTSPRGAYIWRGDLMEGFFALRFWRGLVSEFYGRPFPSCPSPCFKKIWTEWFFISMKIELISTRKVLHFASFWKRQFLNSEMVRLRYL